MSAQSAMRRRQRLVEAGNYLSRARYASLEATQAIENMESVLDAGGFRMSEADAVLALCERTIALMQHAKVAMMFSPDREDD